MDDSMSAPDPTQGGGDFLSNMFGTGAWNPNADPAQFAQSQRQMGLLGMAGGLLGASGPSRMPVSPFQTLGAGLQGYMQGAQSAQQAQAGAQQLAQQRIQTQMQQAMLPVRVAQMQQLAQGGSGPSGGLTLQDAIQRLNTFSALGQDGAARAYGNIITNMLTNGREAGPGGMAPIVGAPNALATTSGATAGGAANATTWPHIQESLASHGLLVSVGPDGKPTVQRAPGYAEASAANSAITIPAEEAAKYPAWLRQQLAAANIRVDEHAANNQSDTNAAWDRPGAYTPGTTVGSARQVQAQGQPGYQGAAFDPNDPTTKAALGSVAPQYQDELAKAAAFYKVPVPLAAATMSVESTGGRNMQPSSKGALGPMGVLPGSPQEAQALSDPKANIWEGMRRLRAALDQAKGDVNTAAIIYHNGPNSETAGYLPKINAALSGYQKSVTPQGGPPAGGGPAIVPESPQPAEASALGTHLANVMPELDKQAGESRNALTRIQQARTAIQNATKNGIPPGYFSPELAESVAAAKSLGIDPSSLGIDPKAVGNTQQAQEALVQISGEILKRLFPQRITNMDLKTYGQSLPNFGMDPAALDQVLGIAEKQAHYDVNKAVSAHQYRAKNGTLNHWEDQFYSSPEGYGPNLFDMLGGAPSGSQPPAASPPTTTVPGVGAAEAAPAKSAPRTTAPDLTKMEGQMVRQNGHVFRIQGGKPVFVQ